MSRIIAGTYNSGIYLTDTTDNPVSVTGTIDVTSGYAISGTGGSGETWTVDNAGVLQAAGSSVVNLGSPAGNVANGVVINETGGTIAGGDYGVSIWGPGTVANRTGAAITAVGSQGVFIYGTGTVTNSGAINAGNVGVYLAAGGSVINSAGGTIAGAGGVWLQQAGTVTNAGTITGTNPGFGAVMFEGYTSYNRLIVDPGAVFNGNVGGGDGVLELAQGNGAPTVLYGVGTTITNFSTLQFDPGAAWTVVGDAAGLGGTITGFNLLSTIDLTGFAAVSETFAYNALLLSNGAGSYATLQIQGNFPTSDFQVSSDGNGGSLVNEQVTPGTYNWIGANGDWNTPGDWDHGGLPGLTDTAVIAGTASSMVTIAAAESAGVANLVLGANTLEVDGTLATSGTLTISAGQVGLMPTGLIDGGTIADAVGNGFVFNGGTFNAVTYQGPLEIATDGATLFVTNGLTVTDATGTMPGTIDLTQGGDARIDFVNSQTFDNATLDLNGADPSNPLTGVDIGGADSSVLTIGPSAIINSDVPSARAEIGSTGTAQTAVVNQGTIIAAASGGSFVINPLQDFTNQGTIAVGDGDSLSIQPGSGTFDNSGYVSVDGSSTLRIAGSDTTPSLSNTGTISLAGGGTLDLAGWFTVPSLGTLINQGAITQIDGTFDGQGGTLALGDGTELGTVLLGGDIRNANVLANGALSIIPGNASLLNDVYEGPIDLTTGSTGLMIHEGVTETGATGLLPGIIDVTGSSDTLAFANLLTAGSAGQTLDNVTINIGNAQAADAIQPAFNGGTFTVGTNATIVSAATGALANLTAGPATKMVLDGTLTATGEGGTFTIAGTAAGPSATTFNNDGLMQVGNGDTLNVTMAIMAGGGNGTTDIGTGGVADFSAAVAPDQTVAFTGATGILRLHQPSTFAASIAGFAAGDTIDLAGIPATAAIWTAGTLGGPGQLTISDAGTNLATLPVLGDYSTGGFSVTGDGAGGSVITYGTQAHSPPPVISDVPGNQILPQQATGTPFSTVRVTDSGAGDIDTATVTLSTPAAGTLANLGGGSYDPETGVYSVTGTPGAVTTALDGLTFDPAATASAVVSTVTFSLSAEGPGGSTGASTTSLTEVRQFLSLASVPASQVAISSSPDGSFFAAAVPARTNEAVVTDPSPGGIYGLPDGYQAEFLGGTADATLTDTWVGNAMLVGNSGNDTLAAAAGNDTIIGGSGNNVLLASGTGDVIGANSVVTANTSGSNDTLFGCSMSLTATDSGTGDELGLGSGGSTVTLSGSGASVYANAGASNIVDAGTNDAVGGFTGDMALTVTGSGSSIFAGTGNLSVDMASTASGMAIGAGNGAAMITIAGSGAVVYGGFGSLSVDVTSNGALIGAGVGAAAITISGSGASIFGGTGSLNADVTALAGGAVIGLDSGPATLTLAGSGAQIFGNSGSLDVVDLGVGDTISAGSGDTTVTANGSNVVVMGGGGTLQFVGGAGGSTVFGGSGPTSVTGGAGTNLLAAGSGPTTLVGGGNDQLFAGAGNDVIVAGPGGSTISGGSGSADMTAGSGVDLFSFVNGLAGGQDVISNFVQGQDHVQLSGYDPNVVQICLANAATAGGSTTITLPDNTTVTFVGIGRMTANDFV